MPEQTIVDKMDDEEGYRVAIKDEDTILVEAEHGGAVELDETAAAFVVDDLEDEVSPGDVEVIDAIEAYRSQSMFETSPLDERAEGVDLVGVINTNRPVDQDWMDVAFVTAGSKLDGTRLDEGGHYVSASADDIDAALEAL